MNLFSVLADVIAWPFYVMGGAVILLAVALVAVVVAVTVGIIRKRRRK